MKFGLIGTLAALLCCGASADTNQLQEATTNSATAGSSSESTDLEYAKIVAEDEAAQEEVDKWIKDNNEFVAKGAGVSAAAMKRRVSERLEPVRKAYEDFLLHHPNHVKGRLAFASFLGDFEENDAARKVLERALELDPKNPVIYNNLAEILAETGPVTNAFAYYGKAIELNPGESLYYHNLGNAVYLLRKEAMNFYHLSEQEVFEKALTLRTRALALEPTNFPIATDLAMTYYGIKPLRAEDALKAWTNAMALAHDDIEREGVWVHLARIKLADGRFPEARAQAMAVTNEMYANLKSMLMSNLERRESEARTNSPAQPGKP